MVIRKLRFRGHIGAEGGEVSRTRQERPALSRDDAVNHMYLSYTCSTSLHAGLACLPVKQYYDSIIALRVSTAHAISPSPLRRQMSRVCISTIPQSSFLCLRAIMHSTVLTEPLSSRCRRPHHIVPRPNHWQKLMHHHPPVWLILLRPPRVRPAPLASAPES